MPTTLSSILALDVGTKRVGVAVASLAARLPRPLITLARGDNFFEELRQTANKEDISAIVVGLPRGLDGQHTPQTESTEKFVDQLRREIDLPVHLQDEALTSKKAEAELEARGGPYDREAVDALAATYILEDFLAEREKGTGR